MNRNSIYLILLVVLSIVAGYFYFSDRTTTLHREFSDFTIEDTAVVNKIFISDNNGANALLERQNDDNWKVNGKFLIRRDAIDLLLETFKRIAVKEPVTKTAFETVVKELATRSTKVEIYTGEDLPEKIYYVGHATKTHHGTNMLLEIDGKKSSVPYVTHVPGFYGYLSTRFFTDEDLWRQTSIFDMKAADIDVVELRYQEHPDYSFRVSLQGKEFIVSDPVSGLKEEKVSVSHVREYLDQLARAHFEYIDNQTEQKSRDSVLASTPLHEFSVESSDGRMTKLKTYYKPVSDSTLNPNTGQPYGYNLDRLYGWKNDRDFVILQWPTMDKLLMHRSDFISGRNVDN